MSNSAGTIVRITALMGLLIGMWFGAFAALYALILPVFGMPFEWGDAGIGFALLAAFRMVYPRNVFRG